MNSKFLTLGIMGAGAMGREIAQIAVQAGCTVLLFNLQMEAAQAAHTSVCAQ